MSAIAPLSAEDRKWLLRLARRTLEHLEPRGSEIPEESVLVAGQIPEPVLDPRGAFVSLHAGGALRGCIGYVRPVAPLYRSVIENAVNAARCDPRFEPVRPDEVAGLEIEISAMRPPREIQDANEVQVGRDGLIVSRKGRRGLLLPQVAAEYGWDREAFLQHTCRKAGLPDDAWRKPDTRIETFSAEVFSEEDYDDLSFL